MRFQIIADMDACQEAGGQDEHVCDGVFEADGDEHGDGEPGPNHFARHVLCHGTEPHCHAEQPVAHHALDQRGPKVGGTFPWAQ